MRFRISYLLPVLLLSTGCTELTRTAAPTPHPTASTVAAGAARVAPTKPADLPCVETAHGCVSTNPDVTQDTIQQTVCVPGYTKSVRPATSYTNGVKRKLLRDAGIDESHMGEYELDHLIPLAVGGHPRKLTNLMLQPWDGERGAHRKDELERRLQVLVCKGKMLLIEAQQCIAEDWLTCEGTVRGR